MVKRMPNRRYAYFRDDQIVFLVTHTADTVTESELKEFEAAISQHLGGRTITVTPQAFSFPALTVEDRRQGIDKLRDLEIIAKNEALNKRLAELRNLIISLSDKKKWDSLAKSLKINKLLKDEDREKLLQEVKKRDSFLVERQALADDQPKLFESAFSLLRCDLNITPDDVAPESLIRTIQVLRKESKGKTFGSLKVENVSPNWLMSVSSQGGATGGPGALPMPFIPHPEKYPEPPSYAFSQLIGDLMKAELYDEGKNVDVAILDTAPCAHQVVLAAKEWPDHDLIQNLLAPSGKLKIYRATDEALWRMASTSINQHDYPMTNHGLFAAGIVHSIVPQARIHLIEVLNESGVGDLASLADGLSVAYDQIYNPKSGRRLVVNCSWMLELPLSDLHCSASDEDPEYAFEQSIRQFIEDDEDHALTLRTICNNLAVVGGVVAAAGNDREHAKARRDKKLKRLEEGEMAENINRWIDYLLEHIRGATPEARYPAAFASVVGVGALPKGNKRNLPAQKYESSNYSNLGDKPAGDAVMTLGGEEGEDNEKKNNGILGLYLGEKFPRVKNKEMPDQPHKREIEMYEEMSGKHPLAWWAGTSFAAPILTGAIASVLGKTGIRRTQEAVNALKGTLNNGEESSIRIIEEAGTNFQEDVMYVKQG